MNEEQFWEAQRSIEALDLSWAMGQDMPDHMERLQELESAIEASGWKIDMDTGKAIRK